jgi:integrase
MEIDQLRGGYVDPRRGAQLVRDYAEEKFLPSLVHLRPNSVSTYESHLRKHVYSLLGGRRIGSLLKSDIKSFVAVKAAERAPSTVETIVAVVRAMLASAAEDGVIAVNPAARVQLPEVTRRVLVPLEPSQVLALARAASPRYRVSVVLGAGAGLRFGEATGLTVPRAELLRRRRSQLTSSGTDPASARSSCPMPPGG